MLQEYRDAYLKDTLDSNLFNVFLHENNNVLNLSKRIVIDKYIKTGNGADGVSTDICCIYENIMHFERKFTQLNATNIKLDILNIALAICVDNVQNSQRNADICFYDSVIS